MTIPRFPCTRGGAIAQGRTRLRRMLMALGMIGMIAAAFAFGASRTVPALMGLGAGALALFARRMSTDLEPLWLELADDRLIVQLRRQREFVTLPGTRARRLGDEEIRHLEGLATSAGITAGTGGFDSHLLGELDLYASDFDHAVLIDRGETSLVLTPDDPNGFLAAIASAGTIL